MTSERAPLSAAGDAPTLAEDRTADFPRSESGGLVAWQPNPLVIVISGPSGAGKDAVIERLLALDDSSHFVVTATSRPRRQGECDGVHYHFFSAEEFERRLGLGEFLEHALIYGDHYGVLRRELTDALDRGEDVVVRVDVQGARTLRSLLPEAVFVFVVAESEEELLRRLHDRGSEDEQSLARRGAKLRQELSCLADFDYVVVNRRDCLEEAVQQLVAIMTAEKLRVRQRVGSA